ncbi:MAG: DUF86 domain-containing protein [Methanophagales archaeon]|nr:DUF86 domain-containing protein [Methanophagales archaeon]
MVSESTLRRVERFEKGLELLEEVAQVRIEEYSDDLRLQSISERNLQVCIETITDLANVIIAKKGLRVPSTYKDTMKVLQEDGILSKKLAQELEELVGLRNIIVHAYADIKAEMIHENIEFFINLLKEGLKGLLAFCKRNAIDP